MADLHSFVRPHSVSRRVTSEEEPVRRLARPHIFQILWLKLHLYVGLIVGLLFVLVSLTGSVLVFYKAIDAWLNPDRLITKGQGTYRALNDILSAVRAAHPDWPGPDSLRMPDHDRGVFLAWYKLPTETPEQFRWIEVTVDPYTAEVRSHDREWGSTVVSFIYELHESLILEKTGETIVGILALLLLVSIGTGLCLWWPRPGKVRQAFTLKREGSVIRWNYDLHKLTGFYSAVILLILAFTGVYLEFPKYVVPLVNLFSPVHDTPKEKELFSTGSAGRQPVSIEQAVAVAQEVFPDGQLKFISLPHEANGVYRVGMRRPGEVRESSGQSHVWVDQYTGAVQKVRDWQQFTAGDTFVAWLFPLHNGEAFGLAGRWIVFVSGFVPLILYVTAIRMWWKKRQAHRRQKERIPNAPLFQPVEQGP